MEVLDPQNPLRRSNNPFRTVDPGDESKRVLGAARSPGEHCLRACRPVMWIKGKRDGFMTKLTNDEIRTSTERDFKAIADWLRAQEDQGIADSFYCNLEIIEASHKKGEMLVYLDGTTGCPVAFQLGGLILPGILEVRHDVRGRGIGRKLVEHCIETARAKNECLLKIKCKPDKSIPFWERMGFRQINPEGERKLAYRIIDKHHDLPANGTPSKVVIGFYREDRQYSPEPQALQSSSPDAVRTVDGIVHLRRQVQFFPGIYSDVRDAVVSINVEGETLCCEKAKYPLPRKLGVQRCTNGYFIDRINTTVRP